MILCLVRDIVTDTKPEMADFKTFCVNVQNISAMLYGLQETMIFGVMMRPEITL